jgi:hypothetical protein
MPFTKSSRSRICIDMAPLFGQVSTQEGGGYKDLYQPPILDTQPPPAPKLTRTQLIAANAFIRCFAGVGKPKSCMPYEMDRRHFVVY